MTYDLKNFAKSLRGYPSYPSSPYIPSRPSVETVLRELGGIEGKEGTEGIVNYLIDLLIRSGYLLDRQINSVEEKHRREGGYKENLLKKRLEYKRFSR